MNKNLIVLAAFILLLAGCNNENCPVSSDFEYYFTAKVGQEIWEGECYLDFANEDRQNLFLIPDNNQNYLIAKINFNGIGEYFLSDSSVILIETDGGDVISGRYYSISNPDNTLNIEAYDETMSVINGSFNFKIRKQSITIDVTSGEFKANFINVK